MALMLLLLISILNADGNERLVEKLGSPKFAIRRSATMELYKNLPGSAPAIQKGFRSHDPEVRYRSKHLLNNFARTIQPSSYHELPWIDSLPEDCPERDAVIHRMFKEINGSRSDIPWQDEAWHHSLATEYLIRSLLYQGKDKKEIVELLDKMVEKQLDWVWNHEIGEYPWDK